MLRIKHDCDIQRNTNVIVGYPTITNVKTLGDRIREARKKKGWTQEDLAKAAGATQSAIGNVESDARRNPRILLGVAAALGRRPQWLLNEDGPEFDDGQANVVAAPSRTHRIPVVSWVAAGAWTEATDPYEPGAAYRWEDVDETIGKAAFALEVRGDSMENIGGRVSFPDGCLIYVDPTRKPKSGDFVVVRNNDSNEAFFKQYVVDAGIKKLRPLNDQYGRAQQVGAGTVMVGVVVLKIEKQRF